MKLESHMLAKIHNQTTGTHTPEHDHAMICAIRFLRETLQGKHGEALKEYATRQYGAICKQIVCDEVA